MKKIIQQWINHKVQYPRNPAFSGTPAQYYKMNFEYFLYCRAKHLWEEMFQDGKIILK